MNDDLAWGLAIALTVALAIPVIILHELAHGYAALALGDDTALKAGRLSLKPWRHVDRFGTLLLPGFLIISQLLAVGRVVFMFGWAKPVPVDPSAFRFPRQMMALVALAGPAMNVALAFLAAHILRLDNLPAWLGQAVMQFIYLNLTLGIFNLVPIPPLDGGRITVGLLPARLALIWAQLEGAGLLVMIGLIAIPALLRQQGFDIDPLGAVLLPAVEWSAAQILHLAGVQ